VVIILKSLVAADTEVDAAKFFYRRGLFAKSSYERGYDGLFRDLGHV